SIFFRIFGQAESEPGVKVHGVLHFGGEDVEMVEPLRMAAAIEVVPSQEMRALLHGGVKLDLETEGVGDLQGAALERLLGESVLDAVLGEEARRLVEIALIADLEAEPAAGGRLRLAQHQRVMLVLLAAAQVDRVQVCVLDVEADSGLVEIAACSQIGHVEHDVAGADDVEGRIEDVCRNGHTKSLLSFREGPKDQTRNVEVPGSLACRLRPGATIQIPNF